MPIDRKSTLRGAAAGGVAAAVWALQQPLDKRALRSRYDDVEVLGRFVVGARGGWYAPGLVLHVQNGALFGALYAQIARRLPGPPSVRGALAALAEHLALWPLGRLNDRYHPARRALPQLSGNRRAFAQATWRHALFGAVLGELEHRLNALPSDPQPDPLTFEQIVSSNGHGKLEHAAVAREDE